MAAGLKDYSYELNDGKIVTLRLSALDKAVAGNVAPAGTRTGLRIYNRRSGRKLGIAPRRVVLQRLLRAGDEVNGIPDQYEYRYVTWLSKAAFDALEQDQVLSYGGKEFKVYGFQAEKNNG
jgi:hypothetical protein